MNRARALWRDGGRTEMNCCWLLRLKHNIAHMAHGGSACVDRKQMILHCKICSRLRTFEWICVSHTRLNHFESLTTVPRSGRFTRKYTRVSECAPRADIGCNSSRITRGIDRLLFKIHPVLPVSVDLKIYPDHTWSRQHQLMMHLRASSFTRSGEFPKRST